MRNLLAETYIFYADIYFLQNFIIKIAVLSLALRVNKVYFVQNTRKGILRIAIASFLGTIVEIAGLMLGNSYTIFLALVHLLEIPCMVCFVLGKERKKLLQVIVSGYFFIMVINGMLEIFWNWFGQSGAYLFLLCAACAAVGIGVRVWLHQQQMKKGIFPVELIHKQRTIVTYGFYDSGNHLKDPYTGKGVHIVSEKLIAQLSLQNEETVYVPYQSLGNMQGLIKVYYLEHIRIQKEQIFVERENVPIGIAEENLFQNKKYQVILHEEV